MERFLIFILSLTLLAPAFSSCTKDEPGGGGSPDPEPTDTLSYSQWLTQFRQRADVLVNCQWTPLKDVQKSAVGGDTTAKFFAGVTQNNIPYGGGGKTDSYYTCVGTYVSFYTFLSSVNNPKSKFYDAEARATVGRVFYGNVCTSCVAYCWGVPSYFDTRYVYPEKVPYLKRFEVKDNNVEELKLADAVCWYLQPNDNGHILVISDIQKDGNGKILSITTTESQDGIVHTDTYSQEQFQTFLDTKDKNVKKINKSEVGIKFFRYDWDNYKKYLCPSFDFCKPIVSGFSFPDALCVDRGDKISYSKGTAVIVNILKTGYDSLQVYKDDGLFATKALSGTDKTNDVVLTSLPVGMYKARLVSSDGISKSSYTCFQVGETAFTATKQGDRVIIKYNDPNSEIQFIQTNKSTLLYFYADRVKNGEYVYSWPLGGATSIIVHFAGKYSTYQGAKVTIN